MPKTTNHCVLDYLIKTGEPRTVENYVRLNWMGDKTLADLEREELVEVLNLVEQGLLANVTPGNELIH